jgi:ubiquinol-cytochrome c reductase cytochrome c1 subunit
MLRKTTVLAAFGLALAFAAPAFAETTQAELKDVHWSFDNPVFGKFDQEQLQRGYKVYHDVCATCHSMNLMTFGDMAGKGGPFYDEKYPNPNDNPKAKALAAEFKVADIDHDTGDAIQVAAATKDHFKAPFANEWAARAANGGALPPDMSLLAKAREGGPAYIYSLVTSYQDNPPAGLKVAPGKYYNPIFPGDLSSSWAGDKDHVPQGGLIGMPPPLRDNAVTYDDGVAATKDQEAKDVAAFLAWAAEPHADERKQTGFAVMIYLFIFAGILYASYKRIWRNIAH